MLRDEVLDVMPRYLEKDGVVAVGEIGFDSMTAPRRRGVRRAARAREGARAAGARPHAAPRQGGRHAPDARGPRATSTSRPSQVARRPQQRADRRHGRSSRAAGPGFSDLPVHQDGRAPHGRASRGARAPSGCSSTARPTGASATRSRSSKTAAAMQRGGLRRRRRRPPRLAQPGRVLRPERPARARGDVEYDRAEHVRGQLGAAGRAGGELARMRFRHPDGSVVHLAYCTNVHPAEDVEGIARPAPPLRRPGPGRRWRFRRLGLGLWISAERGRRLWSTAAGRSSGCGRSSTAPGSRS